MRSQSTTTPRVLVQFVATFVVACAAVVLACGSAARADTTLRWKFNKGEKTNYELKMDTTQEMQLGGAPVQIKATQTMDMTWEVVDVGADGTATMNQTIDRIRMEMTLPVPGQAPLKFDSKDENSAPGSEEMAKTFRAMVGQPFVLNVTPLGKVTDFKAPPGMLEQLKNSPMKEASAMFSEEGLKQLLGQIMMQLPAEAVSVGKTWDNTAEIKNPQNGNMVTTTHYSFAGPEERNGKKLDKIDVTVDVKIEGAGEASQIKVKDNKGVGAVYWDNTAGRPVESTIDSKMTMEMSILGNPTEQLVTTKVVMKQVPAAAAREL